MVLNELDKKVEANQRSVWRPLVDVVQERPLALCDWSTIKSTDWELCDQIHDNRVDEAMYLLHSDHHKWYWLSLQQKSEMSVFVVWDSLKSKPGSQSKRFRENNSFR